MPSSACSAALRDLHSFPTRRSSDLTGSTGGGTTGGSGGGTPTQTAQYRYVADVTFAANGHKRHIKGLERLDMLPSESSPLLLFLGVRSEEHTSELQSLRHLVCRLLLAPLRSVIYTLSLHDALPISPARPVAARPAEAAAARRRRRPSTATSRT